MYQFALTFQYDGWGSHAEGDRQRAGSIEEIAWGIIFHSTHFVLAEVVRLVGLYDDNGTDTPRSLE